MSKAIPGEHKNVLTRILAYTQGIGWRFVPCTEAEVRHGFDPDDAPPEERDLAWVASQQSPITTTNQNATMQA